MSDDPPGGERLVGAAQAPRFEWRKNLEGARTIDAAIEIARRHGVEIPDDLRFLVVPDDDDRLIPRGAYASYGSFDLYDPVSWERDFYSRPRRGNASNDVAGAIVVKVRVSVLESDEAIVAVIAHELHELNALRRLFWESGGQMPRQRLYGLIAEGFGGNLHDQAWDEADRLVAAMRRKTDVES